MTYFFFKTSILRVLNFYFVLGYSWFAVVVSGGQPRDSAINVQKTHLRKDCYPKYTKNFQNWAIRKQPNLKTGRFLQWSSGQDSVLPMQCIWVLSLIRELESHVPYVTGNKEIPARLLYCSPPSSSVHGDSPGKNTGVGCHVLLQGSFPTQGLNHQGLRHQGNPTKRIVAFLI